MIQFYVARVLAYLAARMVIPAVWWYSPKTFIPLIEFNGGLVERVLRYLTDAAPKPLGDIAREVLWLADKAATAIQWVVRWRTTPEVRDHVEVLAKAFFTPGGWLMVAQVTFIIFVMIRIWRNLRERSALRKWRRSERKEPTF